VRLCFAVMSVSFMLWVAGDGVRHAHGKRHDGHAGYGDGDT
jgi:hypothetical protein